MKCVLPFLPLGQSAYGPHPAPARLLKTRQSNQPADKTVIPTILTIVSARGVTVRRIIYPVAREFAVQGLDAPLLVFDADFVVGAEIDIAPDRPAGDVVVTARLRYQACDERR